MQRFTSQLVFALLLATAFPARGDWPVFRGDSALTGVAKTTLADDLKLLWRFKAKRAIVSSAVSDGARAWFGSDDGSVYCVDVKTGAKIWDRPTSAPIQAAPMLFDGRIYVGSEDGLFHCLDAGDGTERWKFQTTQKILGSANHSDKSTSGGALVVFGGYDNTIYGLDAKTGKKVWQHETENYINGAPAIAGGEAVIGGCDGKVYVFSVLTGRKLREVDVDSYIGASVALAGGHAYVGNYKGPFLDVDLNARKIDWEYRQNSIPIFSSAAVTEKYTVFGSRDMRLHCVDRATGQPVWKFSSGGTIDSSPVVAGDKVVFGSSDGFLYIVDLATGKKRWSYEIGEGIAASPAVFDGMILIGAEDGWLYAFGPAPKPS